MISVSIYCFIVLGFIKYWHFYSLIQFAIICTIICKKLSLCKPLSIINHLEHFILQDNIELFNFYLRSIKSFFNSFFSCESS